MKTIAELRQERGWSQSELARRIGVRSQSVNYWEHGAKLPKIVHLRKLANIFDLCSDDIRLPKANGTAPADDPGPP